MEHCTIHLDWSNVPYIWNVPYTLHHTYHVPWSIVLMYSFCTIHIKQLRSTHLQPPCLKLIVQYLEVSSCAGVHAALNLCLSVFVGSCLGFGLL